MNPPVAFSVPSALRDVEETVARGLAKAGVLITPPTGTVHPFPHLEGTEQAAIHLRNANTKHTGAEPSETWWVWASKVGTV